MTAPAFLGIDLGTTRTKVGLFGLDGAPLGFGRAEHAMDVDPATGRAEQDAGAWWDGLGSAIREALAGAGAGAGGGGGTAAGAGGAAGTAGAASHAGRAGDVAAPVAICVAGHGPSLVAVDAQGVPVRPAITWLDSRPAPERGELEAGTGLLGWALGVLPAALWLERHDVPAATGARWYLNSWEAIAMRMTGTPATTVVPGGAALPLEATAGTGLRVDRVAPPVAAGTSLGTLTGTAAAHLGLPAGIPVIAGLVDAFASFHGAGLRRPGDAIDVGGAAGGFGVYADRPVAIRGGFTTLAPLPGLHSVGGAMAATGAALDWLARDVLAGAFSIPDLLAESAGVEPGADGLVFLPYLAGERSPLWDPGARGAFAGLTLRHGRGHLTRAVLEAAALAIRHVAQPVREAGIKVTAMRVCGGPARDDGWNRIKADVTGFPVEVPRVRETAALGAAIVAAVGVGAYPDLPAAIEAMTAVDRRFEPDPARMAIYDDVFEAYIGLHPAISAVLRGDGRDARAGTDGAAVAPAGGAAGDPAGDTAGAAAGAAA